MAALTLVITAHDGAKTEVTPNIQDTLEFERVLKKNKQWGSLKDNSLLLLHFRAWHAAHRLGHTQQTWLEFSEGAEAALDVEVKHDDDAEDEAGDAEGKDTTEGQHTN